MSRFALMVILALLGVLILFSSTPQASGPNSLHAGDLLDETNTELFNPIVVRAPISGTLTAAASPNTPSALARYTFVFQVAGDLGLGVDEIIIT